MTLKGTISKSSEDKICNFVKYEVTFQEFLAYGIDGSKQTFMIYGVRKNNKIAIGYIEPTEKPKPMLSNVVCSYWLKKSNDKTTCLMQTTWKDKKIVRTNKQGPNQIWVPNDKIIYVIDILSNKIKTLVMVYGQWLLTIHDGRRVYVPRPGPQGMRICRFWR